MKKKSSKKIFSKVYLAAVMAFFYLPIVYVVFFSFNESRSLTNFTGFSLQWYQKMFETRAMMESIYYSVLIAVIATVVSFCSVYSGVKIRHCDGRCGKN